MREKLHIIGSMLARDEMTNFHGESTLPRIGIEAELRCLLARIVYLLEQDMEVAKQPQAVVENSKPEHPVADAMLDRLTGRDDGYFLELDITQLSDRAKKSLYLLASQGKSTIGCVTKANLMQLPQCGEVTTREILKWARRALRTKKGNS